MSPTSSDDNDAGDLAEVIARERELLDPACRANPDRVDALLADDFTEVGKSGRTWTRAETLDALRADPGMDGITIGAMRVEHVAAGLAVVRYDTYHDHDKVHRTGWWRNTQSGWRCWYHQATPAATPSPEAKAVGSVDLPTTQGDIEVALREVGVRPDSVVIVHCSMSRLGWVVGGAPTVVGALRSVLGPGGTIVMPAQTGVSDPAHWQAPPVPEAWWPTIREHWPAFDPATTPLRGMGVVAECLARLPNTVHSGHPAVGFVAHGPQAVALMHSHPLAAGLGEQSPLARLYDAEADIVLLGVGHGNNTALHLAEVRALGDSAPVIDDGAPLWVDGRRQWVEYTHLDYDEDDFPELAEAYRSAGGTHQRAPIGPGETERIPLRELVDFGERWIATHR
ncbi:MAG: AAC(3) family N-acetyltransferase [Actinomycetota bacterium]